MSDVTAGALIGRELKKLRKAQGLTQREVAHRLGVHEKTVRRAEAGTFSLNTLKLYTLTFDYQFAIRLIDGNGAVIGTIGVKDSREY
jgi:transcriptional regulator with XRE-family HTH domain